MLYTIDVVIPVLYNKPVLSTIETGSGYRNTPDQFSSTSHLFEAYKRLIERVSLSIEQRKPSFHSHVPATL